jgi:hypothetical protein
MNNSAISLLALAFTVIFTSCKNDLDVLAPGKESVSVYAIINPNQPTQNVRINKVYLTDGDAIAAGQDASTINYGPNELRVTLQRFIGTSTTPTLTTVGNGSRKEIVLTETVVTTASGAFNSSQRLWQTNDKLFGNGNYKLTITNNSTGTTYTAQTTVIDSVKPFGTQQPMPFLYIASQPSAQPMHGNYPAIPISTDKPKYVNYDIPTQTYQIKFRSIPNARLYNVVMRFHYIDSLISGGVDFNFVDYNFNNAKSNNLDGGSFVEDGSGISYFKFTGDEFYKNVGNEMAKKSSANVRKRRAFYMEYIVTAGSENLSEFMQINAPSTTIAQDKPLYSNINGGVGVFSSRSRSIVTKDLWNDFIDKIACHPSTNPYLFCNSSGQISASVCN